MNRRRLLIALAIALPLAILIVAKTTASWRPVAVGRLRTSLMSGPIEDFSIDASRYYVIAGGHFKTIFDVRTGAARSFTQGASGNRAGLREFGPPSQRQLRVYAPDGQLRLYPLPASIFYEAAQAEKSWIAPARDASRIELFWNEQYYRWDARARQLQRSTHFNFGTTGWDALTRDGETLVRAGYQNIERFSTRTGHRTGRVALVGLRPSNRARMSAYGSYALYDGSTNGITHWRVVDTATGRVRWRFDLEGQHFNAAALSADETEIALPLASRHLWQIRTLSSGQILRTLSLMPQTHTGAFAPDGDTLYSVADGVLYRQRAR